MEWVEWVEWVEWTWSKIIFNPIFFHKQSCVENLIVYDKKHVLDYSSILNVLYVMSKEQCVFLE